MSSNSLEQAALKLRVDARRVSWPGLSAAAERSLERTWAIVLRRAHREDGLRAVWQGEELLALLAVVSARGSRSGEERQRVFLEVAQQVPGALEEGAKLLSETLPTLAGAGELSLHAGHAPALIPYAREAGWQLSGMSLVGSVAKGRERLASRMDLSPLCQVRLARAEDLPGMMRLLNEATLQTFPTGAPGLGPEMERRLALDLQQGFGQSWGARVLEHQGALAAWFRLSPPPDSEWRDTAGISLAVGERFRGQGLLWSIYTEALEILARHGVAWLRGATLQPAVLHAGLELGRELVTVQLRPDSHIDRAHFDPWMLRFGSPLS